jgi:hypothetical protein
MFQNASSESFSCREQAMMAMTHADIQCVEQALSVKLPSDYQQLLLDYPFSEDSFATACMVIRDAEALINVNQGTDTHFVIHHQEGSWVPQKNHFLIGNDGGEERYYLDLDDPRSTIFRFELETGELSPYATGIADYKTKIDQIDREIEDEEKRATERRSNAKWWELWKKL